MLQGTYTPGNHRTWGFFSTFIYIAFFFFVDGSESSGNDFYLNDNLEETLKSSQVIRSILLCIYMIKYLEYKIIVETYKNIVVLNIWLALSMLNSLFYSSLLFLVFTICE